MSRTTTRKPATQPKPARADDAVDLAGLAPLHPGNVQIFYENASRHRLVVVIDCAEAVVAAAPPSGSGKSRVLATTGGFAPVPLPRRDGGNPLDGLKLSVTATLPPLPERKLASAEG